MRPNMSSIILNFSLGLLLVLMALSTIPSTLAQSRKLVKAHEMMRLRSKGSRSLCNTFGGCGPDEPEHLNLAMSGEGASRSFHGLVGKKASMVDSLEPRRGKNHRRLSYVSKK